LYKSYYNDIAVLVNGQFILMIEHQSTINPNMPLRLLEYVARIYGNIVDSTAKFSRHLVPLAKPEFIVFYTGDQELPPESYLYLSDAFPKQDTSDETSLPGVLGAGSPQAVLRKGEVLGGENPRFRVEGLSPPKEITLELKVKVCTIKSKHPSPVVHSCTDLEQYVQFLELVEEAKAAGHKHPLKRAIQEAVRRNILRDYLERKGGEVLSILMTEYDYATDMAVLKEEAYEDGLFVGREEGISIGLERGAYEKALETARSMLEDGFPVSTVSKYTSLPLETVEALTMR
ncbi:MAG: Rpn family recombination-promoting nuclease/putative transposase, partial [Spirochaetaceae bacterium]|nr:Rpn family recombination-promoting nuclease/putative transposase [Spirochaetaceae bacterium]